MNEDVLFLEKCEYLPALGLISLYFGEIECQAVDYTTQEEVTDEDWIILYDDTLLKRNIQNDKYVGKENSVSNSTPDSNGSE